MQIETNKTELHAYLAAVINPQVDWAENLSSHNELRLFFDVSALISECHCQQCRQPMMLVALHADRVCVDAEYFIEIENGVRTFELTSSDKIAKAKSTLSTPCLAKHITEIEHDFFDYLVTKIPGHKLEMRDGHIQNICPHCDHAQNEDAYLKDAKLFNVSSPATEKLRITDDTFMSVAIKCSLELQNN